MNVQTWMMLFPVAFMIHDFEELCFLECWIRKNAGDIRNKLTGNIWIRLEGYPTSAMGIAILLMFLFVSFTTILSVTLHLYTLFAAALIVFAIHNLFHIIQPVILGRYVPAMGSAILTLPYPVYMLRYMNQLNLFVWREVVLVSVLFGVVTFVYLAAAQRTGLWVDNQFNRCGERNG